MTTVVPVPPTEVVKPPKPGFEPEVASMALLAEKPFQTVQHIAEFEKEFHAALPDDNDLLSMYLQHCATPELASPAFWSLFFSQRALTWHMRVSDVFTNPFGKYSVLLANKLEVDGKLDENTLTELLMHWTILTFGTVDPVAMLEYAISNAAAEAAFFLDWDADLAMKQAEPMLDFVMNTDVFREFEDAALTRGAKRPRGVGATLIGQGWAGDKWQRFWTWTKSLFTAGDVLSAAQFTSKEKVALAKNLAGFVLSLNPIGVAGPQDQGPFLPFKEEHKKERALLWPYEDLTSRRRMHDQTLHELGVPLAATSEAQIKLLYSEAYEEIYNMAAAMVATQLRSQGLVTPEVQQPVLGAVWLAFQQNWKSVLFPIGERRPPKVNLEGPQKTQAMKDYAAVHAMYTINEPIPLPTEAQPQPDQGVFLGSPAFQYYAAPTIPEKHRFTRRNALGTVTVLARDLIASQALEMLPGAAAKAATSWRSTEGLLQESKKLAAVCEGGLDEYVRPVTEEGQRTIAQARDAITAVRKSKFLMDPNIAKNDPGAVANYKRAVKTFATQCDKILSMDGTGVQITNSEAYLNMKPCIEATIPIAETLGEVVKTSEVVPADAPVADALHWSTAEMAAGLSRSTESLKDTIKKTHDTLDLGNTYASNILTGGGKAPAARDEVSEGPLVVEESYRRWWRLFVETFSTGRTFFRRMANPARRTPAAEGSSADEVAGTISTHSNGVLRGYNGASAQAFGHLAHGHAVSFGVHLCGTVGAGVLSLFLGPGMWVFAGLEAYRSLSAFTQFVANATRAMSAEKQVVSTCTLLGAMAPYRALLDRVRQPGSLPGALDNAPVRGVINTVVNLLQFFSASQLLRRPTEIIFAHSIFASDLHRFRAVGDMRRASKQMREAIGVTTMPARYSAEALNELCAPGETISGTAWGATWDAVRSSVHSKTREDIAAASKRLSVETTQAHRYSKFLLLTATSEGDRQNEAAARLTQMQADTVGMTPPTITRGAPRRYANEPEDVLDPVFQQLLVLNHEQTMETLADAADRRKLPDIAVNIGKKLESVSMRAGGFNLSVLDLGLLQTIHRTPVFQDNKQRRLWVAFVAQQIRLLADWDESVAIKEILDKMPSKERLEHGGLSEHERTWLQAFSNQAGWHNLAYNGVTIVAGAALPLTLFWAAGGIGAAGVGWAVGKALVNGAAVSFLDYCLGSWFREEALAQRITGAFFWGAGLTSLFLGPSMAYEFGAGLLSRSAITVLKTNYLQRAAQGILSTGAAFLTAKFARRLGMPEWAVGVMIASSGVGGALIPPDVTDADKWVANSGALVTRVTRPVIDSLTETGIEIGVYALISEAFALYFLT